jgi:hypothetical protein
MARPEARTDSAGNRRPTGRIAGRENGWFADALIGRFLEQ